MGIFDRSRSETNLTEETTNIVETQTLGQQEVSGVAGAAGGDLEIHIDQIDSGLVAAARGISDSAIAMSGDTVAATLRAQGDTTRDALDYGGRVSRDAFDFSGGVARDAFDLGGRALSAVGDTARAALDFGGRSLSTVEGLAGDSVAAQNRATEYALQSNERVVDRALAATRSDAADILNTSVKYGVIAVGLIAALLLVPQFMKRKAA